MTVDANITVTKIYTKVLLIEQLLRGDASGQTRGLIKRINDIESKQGKFQRYIYMFHGAFLFISFLTATVIGFIKIAK